MFADLSSIKSDFEIPLINKYNLFVLFASAFEDQRKALTLNMTLEFQTHPHS